MWLGPRGPKMDQAVKYHPGFWDQSWACKCLPQIILSHVYTHSHCLSLSHISQISTNTFTYHLKPKYLPFISYFPVSSPGSLKAKTFEHIPAILESSTKLETSSVPNATRASILNKVALHRHQCSHACPPTEQHQHQRNDPQIRDLTSALRPCTRPMRRAVLM